MMLVVMLRAFCLENREAQARTVLMLRFDPQDLLQGNPQCFGQLGCFVVVIKGFLHLGLTTGTFDVNDGGCRECTTFSNVMEINGNSSVSINCLVLMLSSMPFNRPCTRMTGASCNGRGNACTVAKWIQVIGSPAALPSHQL